ncbi:MAG: hypothetical protein MZV65_13285 [Chromatiales bacterium]|nr:hypothetical protein [Chromatiales bacterium]
MRRARASSTGCTTTSSTREEFERMVAAGEFVEHATVFGNSYGTSRMAIEDKLHAGESVILDIDWQGARADQAADAGGGQHLHPAAVARGAARRACAGRGQDSQEVIDRRMQEAVSEMSHYHEFDRVVVNDDFEAALADLMAILRGVPRAGAAAADRCGRSCCADRNDCYNNGLQGAAGCGRWRPEPGSRRNPADLLQFSSIP